MMINHDDTLAFFCQIDDLVDSSSSAVSYLVISPPGSYTGHIKSESYIPGSIQIDNPRIVFDH